MERQWKSPGCIGMIGTGHVGEPSRALPRVPQREDRGAGRSRRRDSGRDRRRGRHRSPVRLPRRGAGQDRFRHGGHYHANLHPPGAHAHGRGDGKHVFLEKPMALDLAECDAIVGGDKACGRRPADRLHAPVLAGVCDAARRIEAGEIGQPMMIRSATSGPGLPPAWARDLRTSNGMLAEVNSHDWDRSALADGVELRTGLHRGRQLERRGAGGGHPALLRQCHGQHAL